MRSKLQQAGLVFTGLCAGVLISLNFSANADKSPLAPLPVEELRNLADVRGFSTWHEATAGYDRFARNLAAGRYFSR